MIDPVALTRSLIRVPSVTPDSADAIALLQELLTEAGFQTARPDRNGIPNLVAWHGESGPTLGFNGHVDVVPTGDDTAWIHPPFAADEVGGTLFGRGACDMKSGVAAFVAAAVAAAEAGHAGRIVLAITGDEEGDGVDGTAAILDWMASKGMAMDACIVGEPTCPAEMGEMVKIGRRGSLTVRAKATGRQGHAAYPDRAANPVHALMTLMTTLAAFDRPDDSAHFDPSTAQITGFDVGNTANNVIPGTATAMANIRFNDAHTGDALDAWVRDEAARVTEATGVGFELQITCSGDSFVTPPGAFSDMVVNSVEAETGRRPVLSTSGGTSDARFVKDHCPVIEVGLVGQTMHQIDERVEVAHIRQLTAIYARILSEFLT